MQVSQAFHRYGRGLGARVLPIYGGQPIVRQLRELERGVDVVVATPGRALDHLSRNTLHLDDIEVVVLDEAEAGLDPQSRVKVREYIQSLARHKTVILTTHNMDEAERIADRVAIIDHGELLVLDTPFAREQEVQSGRADVFMTDYPYSQRFLANADWARLVSPPGTYHVTPYAYAMKPGEDAWFARVEKFLGEFRRDGRLLEVARRYKLDPIVAK